MKKAFCIVLLGFALLFLGVVTFAQPALFGGHVAQAGQSGANIPAGVDLILLDNDNGLFRWRARDGELKRLVKVQLFNRNEQLVGIDYRVSDGLLYGISDAGTIYTIDIRGEGLGNVVRISQTTPRYSGGVQGLMDFNPVLDAVRLIGTNDQNLAVVNVGGNLATTVMQTAITYAAGDANQGQNPNLTGGAYTNNQTGAKVTIFYGVDYSTGSLVTIDPATPGGSSATGAGQLRTIGRLQTFDTNPLSVQPTADLDIYTDAGGANTLIGITGAFLFTLREADIPQTQLGSTVPVVVRTTRLGRGGFLDIAAVPAAKGGKNDE